MSDKFTSREVYVIFIYIIYHISERKADMKKNDDYIKRAAAVVPSERQLKWHELEFYAFIHFGMNTFTNSEWGNGNDDPVLFNPEKLNANQWAAAVRAAGMESDYPDLQAPRRLLPVAERIYGLQRQEQQMERRTG